jgi:hypothetical protein
MEFGHDKARPAASHSGSWSIFTISKSPLRLHRKGAPAKSNSWATAKISGNKWATVAADTAVPQVFPKRRRNGRGGRKRRQNQEENFPKMEFFFHFWEIFAKLQ